MPFNAQSYYRNKAKREAREYLAAAREVKRRLDAIPDVPADLPRAVAFNVRMARSSWKTYLGYLRMDQCDADLKRFQRGQMTYQEFMDKWKP